MNQEIVKLMEQEYFEMNIENWANSIFELEENNHQPDTIPFQNDINDKTGLISLTSPTYYRSKAFSNQVSINNLVNAADPILTLATRLRRITIPPDISVLYQNLCHEIKAFENKAQTLGYRSQLVLAARYMICALLDELITLTLWPKMEWTKFGLVETFHKEMRENDRVFLILERSMQDPGGHIDLLELIYVCLRLGYEGKFRGVERGYLELRNITDQVYSIISHYREEFSRGLLISSEAPIHHTIKKRNYFHLLPPAWIISSIMIIALLIIFTFFYLKLIEAANPVLQLLNSLQTTQETTKMPSAVQ